MVITECSQHWYSQLCQIFGHTSLGRKFAPVEGLSHDLVCTGSIYHVHFAWQVWHGQLSPRFKFNKLKSFSGVEIDQNHVDKRILGGKGFAVGRLKRHNFCPASVYRIRISPRRGFFSDRGGGVWKQYRMIIRMGSLYPKNPGMALRKGFPWPLLHSYSFRMGLEPSIHSSVVQVGSRSSPSSGLSRNQPARSRTPLTLRFPLS